MSSYIPDGAGEAGLSFPPVIDSSMRSEFAACPHAFFRRYIQGLASPGTSIHLHFGACFADGLASLREAFYLRKLPEREAVAAGFKQILRSWGDYDAGGATKSLDRCLGALEAYVAQYPLATDHVRPIADKGRLLTEFAGALPLPILHPETGEPLVYSGRFDMLARLDDRINVIEDDKTTSQLGQTWGQQWRLRAQFTGYAWIAEEYGYRIDGVVVRGISILKSSYGHAEIIEQRPQWMIRQWKYQLDRDINRMIALWKRYQIQVARGFGESASLEWDQNLDTACSSYGGCQFLDLCTSPNPATWLDQFDRRTYDPLGALGAPAASPLSTE